MTTYEYETYEVEIRQTVHIHVRVQAKNPLSAAKITDDSGYWLPALGDDWEHTGDWEYIVRDQTGAELYEGDAQELS
jgi:hypothetical protein